MMLVAIAATAMSLRLQIDINRTQLIKDTGLMMRLAQNPTLSSIVLLKDNLIKVTKKNEHVDNMPYTFPKMHEEGYTINAQIFDEQAKFNLNNLTEKKNILPFAHLLQVTNPGMDRKTAQFMSYAVHEWVSPLNLNKGKTELDTFYETKHYSPSHRKMVSVSEFRLIKGVTQSIYNNTLPFITALPKETPININTASLPVLQTLGVGLSETQAKKIIQKRGKKGFPTSYAFEANQKMKNLNIDPKSITVLSQYYLTVSTLKKKTAHLTLYTLIERTKNKHTIDVQINRQAINTL